MEAVEFIKSLTWSDVPFALNEFLARFGVPNLVCCSEEGHYGMNDVCTSDNNQILVLHALRSTHNLMAEDLDGRPISIPLNCENNLLLCPSSVYCKYDTVYVSQMPLVYPDIKYFRVLENHWDKQIKYLKPESILEIEYIDFANSVVKFKDIEQPLPLNCRVVFEPLLDYGEYTLKDAVSLFGLPAKVRFLPNPNANQEFDNEFENLVSNLGKVTVVHSAKPQAMIVATKFNADSSNFAEASVTDCLQIPLDYNLNVCVPKKLLENDPAYVNIVKKMNGDFFAKYDLKGLDNFHKCHYLDESSGNVKRIIASVLVANVHGQNAPELLPRSLGNVKFPPIPPPKPTSRKKESTSPTCDEQAQESETVGRFETCDEKEQNVGQYDDVGNRSGARERCDDVSSTSWKDAYKSDYHTYESISDSSSDSDGYEKIDDNEYEDVDDHVMNAKLHGYVNATSPHDYVDMTSHDDYVDMTSHDDYVDMTSQDYVDMTAQAYINMVKSPKIECKNENQTKTTKLNSARKLFFKLPFLANSSSQRTDDKTSTETTRLQTKSSPPRSECNDENLTETTQFGSATKSLVKRFFPADSSTSKLDNKTATETTRLETKLSLKSECNDEYLTETTKLESAARKGLVKLPFPARLDNKTFTETTRLETKSSPMLDCRDENRIETTNLELSRKGLVKLPFSGDPSSPRLDKKTTTETTALETKLIPPRSACNVGENLTEMTKLQPARKVLVKLPFPTDSTTPKLDNKTSTETTRLESKVSPKSECSVENVTETKLESAARKGLVKLPFPADASSKLDNKTSTETTRLESKVSPKSECNDENLTEAKLESAARKGFVKLPCPDDPSTPRLDNINSTETTNLELKNEALDKSIKLDVDNKTSQKVAPISPTDPSTQNLTPGNDNSGENTTLKPIRKTLVPKPKIRPTYPTRKLTFPILKDQRTVPVRRSLSVTPIPTELSCLSVEGVGRLLASVNMACYADTFQEEQIDGEILMELDETTLKSLDLKPFHVRKLLKVIAGWRPNMEGNN